MATKKTTATAAEVETKKAEAKASAPVQETAAEAKETVKAEPEKKAPAKKTAAKKETAKKETVKKETVKKETVKKETVKPEPVKRTAAKKAVSAAVVVQFSGQEISMDAVVENVKKAFEVEGNKVSAIKDIQVYVKPEENAAYYVINQDITGKINLF